MVPYERCPPVFITFFPSEDCAMSDLFPARRARMEYVCTNCASRFGIDELLYTCPACGGVFLLEDLDFADMRKEGPQAWRDRFDARRATRRSALRGVFRFYELMAPVLEEEDIVYLGEGDTPIVPASSALRKATGLNFAFKNDGQNPSASFKDRGMAAALSYLNHLIRSRDLKDVLAVCASTGDTSAAAALYSAALGAGRVKSAVLLPKGKVTLPQLSQPLGAGAKVFELPGVFDDCMKVVEYLSENYQVALLNSKNPWRVLGQESYAYELAQQFDYEVGDLALFVPVGNAGNITAIMSGFLKMRRYGVIEQLPKIVAVQSSHADPVFKYYSQSPADRQYQPVTVRPSVAQAAMIGDPVSFPRVVKMAEAYHQADGRGRFHVVQVEEQDIMDNMIKANRCGLTICTQGGEGLAGLRQALKKGLVTQGERAVIDSTAHALKFAEFQNAYFDDRLQDGFEVTAKNELVNRPVDISPQGVPLPEAGRSQSPADRAAYVSAAAADIAKALGLRNKN